MNPIVNNDTNTNNENDIDNMNREEFMQERHEMELDVDPQANDTEESYQSGYTNSCTFDFLLESDREIFEDFQEWALPILNATTLAEEAIQQSFLGSLDLDSSCYFSDIEIFNIWFYKTNRTIYWICKNEDTFNIVSDNHEDFEDKLDAMLKPSPVIPFFIYGNVGIIVQVFFIDAPFLGVTHSIQHHSIWCYEEIHNSYKSGQIYINRGDDNEIIDDEEEDEAMSNWDMNNADITEEDLEHFEL